MKITANRLLFFLLVIYFIVSKGVINLFIMGGQPKLIHYILTGLYLGVWLIYIFYIIEKRAVTQRHIKFSIIVWTCILATSLSTYLLVNLHEVLDGFILLCAVLFMIPLCSFNPLITGIIAAAVLTAFLFVKRLELKEKSARQR